MPTRDNLTKWSNPPAWASIALTLILLLLVAVVDVLTGPKISLALFYLLPVASATLLLGSTAGYCMVVISGLAWLRFDHYLGSRYELPFLEHYVSITNAVVHFTFFCFSVPVLASWKNFGSRLAQMVESRTTELRAEVVERKRAERALRELAGQLSAAEDAERRRIAYDLHDGLTQMLSLLKMNLETALGGTSAMAPQRDRLADSVRMVDSLIQQTRSLTFDLHPSMLDDLGLVATLHNFARDFGKRANIEVTVTEHGMARPIPESLTYYLFRAVKELLNNAMKHGKAKEIVASVHWESEQLRVVVDDDGCGFDPALLPQRSGPRGLGLPGIGERLNSYGGDIHLESMPGQGTRVILEVSLDAQPVAASPREFASSSKNEEVIA